MAIVDSPGHDVLGDGSVDNNKKGSFPFTCTCCSVAILPYWTGKFNFAMASVSSGILAWLMTWRKNRYGSLYAKGQALAPPVYISLTVKIGKFGVPYFHVFAMDCYETFNCIFIEFSMANWSMEVVFCFFVSLKSTNCWYCITLLRWSIKPLCNLFVTFPGCRMVERCYLSCCTSHVVSSL